MLERSFVIGIDHHATPIGVREALSKITEAEAIEGLKDHAIHSPVVVSTCNRYEVYGISDSPVVARQAVEQLLRGKDMELDSFGGRLYHKTGVGYGAPRLCGGFLVRIHGGGGTTNFRAV